MSAWDDPVAHIRGLEADRDALMRATWSAYVETGADTDGDEEWHCSPEWAGKALMHAVATLRKDYDDSLDESTALEAEVERLRGEHAEAEWLLRMSENARDQAERKAEAAEALADEWTAATCITDGAPCSFHRHADGYATDLRAALEGR